jgi:sterol desaturase/sphingolipid hydroxylase (fatty acid hydroxylase superfamily)/rhodanese-related sulfurtransferase
MRILDTIKLALVSLVIAGGLCLLFKPHRHTMNALQERIRRDFPEVRQITSAELTKMLAESGPLLLFDVRTAPEYKVSHLPGALRLDPGTLPADVIKKYSKESPAVLYCSVGYRASRVARALSREGWTTVSVLQGSIFQWVNEGRTLECEGRPTKLVHPYSASYVGLIPPEVRYPLPMTTMFLNELPSLEKVRLGLGISLLIFFLTWESFAPSFRWFGNRRERLLHGWRNYLLGLLNVILAGLLFVQLWLFISSWAETHRFGLLNQLPLPDWLRIATAIMLLDLWTYCWHRFNHRFSFLWRFHRTHHTELHLDVSSAVRFHFGEIACSGIMRIPLILLLGLKFHELLIYEMLLFAVVQFQHANIRLPSRFEAWMSKLIVTPDFHRIHHSQQREEANSNYSSLLSCWDRLFRTKSPASHPKIFGVKGMNGPSRQTLIGLIESPLE